MNLRRRTAVLWAIAAGTVVLGAGAQTWIQATGLTGLPGTVVTTSGNQAAAVVPAMALVGMASGIALSMARRVGRVVTAGLLLLAGVVTGWASVHAALSPADAARAQVSAATGTTADAGAYAVTAWPWVTLAAGVLLAACGIAVLVAGRGWRDSRRYDTRATASGASTAANAAPGPAAGGAGAGAGPVDEIDAWDDLSRGEDPT
ncbi:MAG: Trp biosynthesis-associated membrane protein [Micrococcus sp.]|nr:Trp biosynthesis-associated membrane protein [Micrococcus sp.]